jgi:hypothetical protein
LAQQDKIPRAHVLPGVRLIVPAWFFVFCALLCACGGGGGGATPGAPAGVSTTPASTTTTPPSAPAGATSATSAAISGTATTAGFATIQAGYGGAVAFPASSSSGTASLVLGASNPNGVPVPLANARLPKAIGGSLTTLAYVSFSASAPFTFATWPAFTFTLPSNLSLQGSSLYLAFYNPANTAGGWSTLAGPATVTGLQVAFASVSGPITFSAGQTYAFALIATGQVLVSATPTPIANTPTTSPSGLSASAFTCPTTATASFGRSLGTGEATHRRLLRNPNGSATANMLAITYNRSSALVNASQIAVRERQLGLSVVHSFDYPGQNIAMHVVSVPSGSLAQTAATLRAQPGVTSVAVTGQRRYRTTSSAYYPSDPYFQGFVPNFEQAPLAGSSSVPGQWDMHVIGLEHAFGYSQSGATVAANPLALGSSSIKIAIIDTGEDASHPELNSKIAYQHCFITNDAGTAQSSGNFTTDADGHGTDVSGIAAAAGGNNLGFVGAGGNAVIYAYRIFPTPDDNCASDGSDDVCSANTADIASAITDAIAQHVNVISMSLGGGGCTNGMDSDTTEGSAVAAAIAAKIIVVAASGNSGTSSVTAPGCDTGVIAAGATSLDDGQTTGTSGNYTSTRVSTASAANPVEYVASYSQYGSPAVSLHSAIAWGIVAPGGDPGGNNDDNDLHWIENIWTSTPFVSFAGDPAFAGECSSDFGSTSQVDCRTLIAGTSMSTPHVAGAAALILAATGGLSSPYQSPAAMKTLLCQTADDLGDSHEGCGRLNVYRAMAIALNDPSPP